MTEDNLTRVECPDIAPRPANSHKGTFGRVLLIGGSKGMSGAACLAATAALRGGAGLVFAAIPESIQGIVASFEPGYMTIGLRCASDGLLDAVDPLTVAELISGKDVVAIGPGLGQSSSVTNLVRDILKQSAVSVVLDADGLNVAAEHSLLLQRSNDHQLVITPHPGEFSRLTGLSTDAINQNREASALKFAREHRLTVVLKGPETIVTDGQRVYTNSTGNPGMATGGSGDVLTGLLAAQIGQGLDPFEASCLAVHVHGLAGDLAAEQLSQRGMIASDLLNFIPLAWKQLER